MAAKETTDRRNSRDPDRYAGVFHCYAEIPERYRLQTFAPQYAGEDTWQTYVETVLFQKHPNSETIRTDARTAERSWRTHMDERGRHHALATPADAKTWCQRLLDGLAVDTCYKTYFLRIYQFYEYLKDSYRHPHLYNPLLLAAIEDADARRIWRNRNVHPRRESRDG